MEAYWKNEFARLEQEQEERAFLSKMEEERAAWKAHEEKETALEKLDFWGSDSRPHHTILEKKDKYGNNIPYFLISYDIFEERSTQKAYATRDWSGQKYYMGKPAMNRFKWIAKSICIEYQGGIFAPSWALSDAYFHNHEYGNSSRSVRVNM